MSTLTFSIPEEIKQKITEKPGYSSLITELIAKHFEKGESLEMMKIRREEFKKTEDIRLKELNYQIEIKEKEMKDEIQLKQDEIDKEIRIKEAVAKRIKEMKAKNNKPSFKDNHDN